MAVTMVFCAGLGVVLGYWLDVSNRLASRAGLELLRAKPPRFNAYVAVSGLVYCFLMLAGAAVCLLLVYVVTSGVLNALYALLAGLVAYLAATRLRRWGRSVGRG
jgi:hypothetical protein